VDPRTGKVLRRIDLEDRYFAEGLAVVDSLVYQLTWQHRLGFIYDRETFARRGEFHYSTEGWGLTYDGTNLIMSDGSPVLHFLDPATLTRVRRLQVRDGNRTISRLNELEFVDGIIYANVWPSDTIVQVDALTGELLAWIDCSGLHPKQQRFGELDVLNGIAYDRIGRRFFITGKKWPQLYQVEFVPIQKR
jgi:glutamine cyclotransferase